MYAIRKGYIIAVISGGGAPGVRERLEKLGVRPEDIYLKVANKTEALAEIEQRYSLDKEAIMYMGDDIPDYKVMTQVGLPVCPLDACEEIKSFETFQMLCCCWLEMENSAVKLRVWFSSIT